MKLRFLGAASTVTGSQFLLSTGRARVLVDCGYFQGSPSEVARNRLPFGFEPAEIDAVLLTHAHLDHCGLLPLLAKRGYHGPIYSTRATAELARLVLLDSAKIQVEQARDRRKKAAREARREAERDGSPHGAERSDESAQLGPGGVERRGRGRPWPPDDPEEAGFNPEQHLRAQPPEIETTVFEPLYTTDDAQRALQLFRPIDYDQPFDVASGVSATLRDAGHILGSAIVVLDADDGGGPRRFVFSGDLGRPDTPIIRDPTAILDGADYVVVESTYGGREHEPDDEAVRLLAEVVRVTAESSGVLVVPAFAIGRTQEIVWHLDRLLAAGEVPHIPLYLDSPMATRASDVYRQFAGYYDEETYRLLEAGETPLDYPDAVVTQSADASRAIASAPRPLMIVASNGMLTGGRVVQHVRRIIDDPAATILFVGYQGEGTLGAHLQAGKRRARIDGEWRDVRCQVRSISGFSAHADESELLDWLRHFAGAPRRPRHVFLVHGDPGAREALADRVRELTLEPYLPEWREEVELT